MQTSSLLGHVQEAYALVMGRPQPADLLLREFLRARKYLGAKDRRFIADATYALVRWKVQLDEVAARIPAPFAGRPAARAAALAARGKIAGDPEEIAGAAATLLRAGSKDMTGFARSARDVRGRGGEAALISFDESFPLWMVERWIARFGLESARKLAAALNEPAPTTLRANTLKCTRDELLRSLGAEGIDAKPAPLAPDGVTLAKRVNIFESNAFRQGKFEMQDEGSQLVSLALDPHPDWRVLDACAGSGGKTLHLAALMRGRGEVYAFEPDGRRRHELKRRVRRSGAQNVRILDAAPAAKVDALLVDAPCSGTGTIRRNPMIKNRLAPEDLLRHQAEQVAVLLQWAPCLRPGGLLAYATCSLMEEENEQAFAMFLERSGFAARETRLAAPSLALPATLFPHVHGTDGFFLAHATAPSG